MEPEKREPSESRGPACCAGILPSVARGLALGLGFFALANLLAAIRTGTTDLNLMWVDLRGLPQGLRIALTFGGGLSLLTLALRPGSGRIRRTCDWILIGSLVLAALRDCLSFWGLVDRGEILTRYAWPLSLPIALALLFVLCATRRAHDFPLRVGVAALTVALGALLFPLGQMVVLGRTNYEREADVIVVFGAGVFPDGTPSQALSDRVLTGSRLLLRGSANRILFSGGPGMGAVHETEAMRDLALELGVPRDAILLDPDGLDTAATVRNSLPCFREHAMTRVLAVSHFYHLPRIKLCYQRAGLEVFTVPAEENRALRRLPYYMAREVAAFWMYWGRAITA